jgi:hypothetical protein
MGKLRLSNIRIGPRLSIAFGFVTVLLLIVSIAAWSATGLASSTAKQDKQDVSLTRSRVLLHSDAFIMALDENSVAADFALNAPPGADLASFQSDTQQFQVDFARATAAGSLTRLEGRYASEAERAYHVYVGLSDQANSLFKVGTMASTMQAESNIQALAVHTITDPVDKMVNAEVALVNTRTSSAGSSARTERDVALVISLLALLATVSSRQRSSGRS